MATIRDIARISGYSTGTVSRVINHRSDVSAEARKKIEQVIREENFRPNTNARHLKQSISSSVMIIVSDINSVFLNSLLEEVQSVMRMHGQKTAVTYLEDESAELEEAVRIEREYKPKGFVFLGGSHNGFRKKFGEITTPSVLVTTCASDLGFDLLSSFSTDDRAAGYEAVSQLIAAGHTRIGIIGGTGDIPQDDNISLRIEGAVSALADHGLVFEKERDYEPCGFSFACGYQAVQQLLERTCDITALFALSDTLAVGAMRGLKDMGLSVPDRISLVGFDGLMMSDYTIPRLTTIKQDINRLAGKTVDEMLMRMNSGRPAVHETVPYEFITGESTAPLHRSF